MKSVYHIVAGFVGQGGPPELAKNIEMLLHLPETEPPDIILETMLKPSVILAENL